MPFDTMALISAVVTPAASAKNLSAGMPVSDNCISSSPLTLPLAFICPKAKVKRSIMAVPPPNAPAASPKLRRVGMTSSAAKPYAIMRFAAPCKPINSKGVESAKLRRSASILLAFSALPSMVPKAILEVSSAAASSKLLTIMFLRPPTIACKPI